MPRGGLQRRSGIGVRKSRIGQPRINKTISPQNNVRSRIRRKLYFGFGKK